MTIDHVSLSKLTLRQQQGEENADKAKVAGEQFEGYLVQMMVREMRKTVPEGIFSSQAMSVFMDLFDQTIAEEIASQGGLGLADSLKNSLQNAEDGTTSQLPISQRSFRSILELGGHSPRAKENELPSDAAPVEGRLSSKYGMRFHPIKHKHIKHRGIDIAAPTGTAIHAAKGGVVQFAGKRGGYGNLIIIDHGEGLTTRYAHCNAINVKEGQRVGNNQVIGEVGSTGMSTGPHLHFEVRQDGKDVDPLKVFGWKF